MIQTPMKSAVLGSRAATSPGRAEDADENGIADEYRDAEGDAENLE